MKLIIDISEEEYIRICDESCTELGLVVRNGISCPKGHEVNIVDVMTIKMADVIIEADKSESEE